MTTPRIPARRDLGWSLSPRREGFLYLPLILLALVIFAWAAYRQWRAGAPSVEALLLFAAVILLFVIMERLGGVISEVGDINGIVTALLKAPGQTEIDMDSLVRIRAAIIKKLGVESEIEEEDEDEHRPERRR